MKLIAYIDKTEAFNLNIQTELISSLCVHSQLLHTVYFHLCERLGEQNWYRKYDCNTLLSFRGPVRKHGEEDNNYAFKMMKY